MNALERSSHTFKKLLIFNASLLVALSLQRLVLFFVVVRYWLFGVDSDAIAASFFAGFRFDLCVVGFLNIPVLFMIWILSISRIQNSSSAFLQSFRRWGLGLYLGMVTFLLHFMGMLDMMYFAANGRRWTYYDLQESGLSFIFQVTEKWGGLFTSAVILFFITLWFFRCLLYLYRLRLHTFSDEVLESRPSLWRSVLFGVILPFLVVASAARGTWTAHHINIEHAQVSQNPALVQMALSPVWAFDKKF